MKVLLVSNNPPSPKGGIERHCYNLLQLFAMSDISMQSVSKQDIPYFRIKCIDKIIFNNRAIKTIIEEYKPDAIHVHGFASIAMWQVLRIALNMRIKVIYTAHFHPFNSLDNPILAKMFFYILLKPLLCKIHHIITINNEDTSFFKKYNAHVTKIPNWIGEKISLKNVLRKKNMLLFVGRNDSNKSPNYLMSLPRNIYEIHCVTDNARNLRDDFIIHTSISEDYLNLLYSEAALLVVPSRYEAFSYVALEALCHGTPVLLSDRVRIYDYLEQESGVTVFRYGNEKEFKDLIPEALSKRVDVAQIWNIFNADKIKRQLEEIYKK